MFGYSDNHPVNHGREPGREPSPLEGFLFVLAVLIILAMCSMAVTDFVATLARGPYP